MARGGCLTYLRYWAQQQGVRVIPSTAAKGLEMRAPHSELCMHTRCAGKRIRAFAINRKSGMGAIAYTDGKACHFTSGIAAEVIPIGDLNTMKARGLAGARRRKSKRR